MYDGTRLLSAGKDVDGVQPGEVDAILLAIAHDIHCVGGGVDDRGSGHSDGWADIALGSYALRPRWNCRCARTRSVRGVKQGDLPEWLRVRAAIGVRIKGVD